MSRKPFTSEAQSLVESLKLSKPDAAHAAWTLIAEPGDEFAGLLRLTFGAQESFEFLTKGFSANQILGRLKDSESWDLATSRFGNVRQTTEDSLARWLPRLRQQDYESALKLAWLAKAKFVSIEHESWPNGLSDLGLATPAGLWVRGSLEKLVPGIAVVGSRAATGYGHQVCAEFVSSFQAKGLSVVSGGAFGIDASAHHFANRLGLPNFAVMAGGIDRLYPSSNRDLLLEVIQHGAVIAELPPGRNPTKWRFLQRNRLIAAISRAVLVVEAGHRSGAINTANHAVSLGRPVAAVPGAIQNATSSGCHRLIREGVATLVSSPAEFLELAGLEAVGAEEFQGLGALETRVMDFLSRRFQTTTALAARGGFTSLELAIALGSLEMSGLAERNGADCWRRTLNL
jgi:DNA processing protein